LPPFGEKGKGDSWDFAGWVGEKNRTGINPSGVVLFLILNPLAFVVHSYAGI